MSSGESHLRCLSDEFTALTESHLTYDVLVMGNFDVNDWTMSWVGTTDFDGQEIVTLFGGAYPVACNYNATVFIKDDGIVADIT